MRPNDRGAVLLTTLSLVALLSIIALGILARTGAELRVDSHHADHEQARANALFAMGEALSRLQESAGPDRRVTAPASILDDDPYTLPVEGVANPHWTGVWQTTRKSAPVSSETGGGDSGSDPGGGLDGADGIDGADGLDGAVGLDSAGGLHPAGGVDSSPGEGSIGEVFLEPTGEETLPLIARPFEVAEIEEPVDEDGNLAPLPPEVESYLSDARDEGDWNRESAVLRWLVSGAPDADLNPRSELDESGRVAMVGKRSAADRDVPPVWAPRVRVPSTRGGYAYWIGDESLKAKVNINAPFGDAQPELTSTTGAGYRRFTSPDRPPVELLDGLDSLADSDDADRAKAPYLRSLANTASEDEIAALSAELDSRFHQLTTRSFGLLTNSLYGGLRQNLTAYLNSPTGIVPPDGALSGLDDTTPIIDAPRFRYHSPRFGVLRDHWKKRLDLTGTPDAPTIQPVPPDILPHALHDHDARQPAPVSGEHRTRAGLHPVMVENSALLAPAFDEEDELVKVLIFPRVQLYNPYDVALEPRRYVVQLMHRWHKKFYFTVTVDRPGEPSPLQFTYNLNTQWGYQGGRPGHGHADLTFITEPTGFAPGETLTFSPDVSQGEDVRAGSAAKFSWSNQGKINSMVLSSKIDPAELTCFWVTPNADPNYGPKNGDQLRTFRIFVPSWWYPANDYWGMTRAAKLFLAPDSGVPATPWSSLRSDTENFPLLQAVHARAFTRGNKGIWPRFNRTYQFTSLTDAVSGSINRDLNKYWWLGYRLSRLPETPENLRALYGKDFNFPVLGQYDLRAPLVGYQPVSGVGRYVYGINGASDYHEIFSLPWTASSGTEGLLADGLTAPLLFEDRFRSSPFFWPGLADGDLRAPILEIPRPGVPLVSLATLRHASLSAYYQHPTFIIGESQASVMSPRGLSALPYQGNYRPLWNQVQTRGSSFIWEYHPAHGGHINHVHYSSFDSCFEINHALWDHFFLTGIADGNGSWDGGKWDTDKPLPNKRLTLDPFKEHPGDQSDLEGFHRAASHLAIDGPHNVNATDPEIWALLLKSFRGIDIPVSGGTTSATPDDASAFPRLVVPAGEAAEPASSSDTANWAAFRNLSDDQIDRLAESIVAEVKKRAPFISLSDFVNRRLVGGNAFAPDPITYPNADIGLAGALQAAIESPLAHLNPHLDDFENTVAGGARPHNHANRFFQSPGSITQGDLLSKIGPVLAPRGDTFVIRAYGDSTTRNGELTAKAWCEAVVQRTVDYVEPADSLSSTTGDRPETAADDLVSDLNKKLGRRFKILSFRWLNADEV